MGPTEAKVAKPRGPSPAIICAMVGDGERMKGPSKAS